MDQYFQRMRMFMVNPELPSRIRFMLQDGIELRKNGVCLYQKSLVNVILVDLE